MRWVFLYFFVIVFTVRIRSINRGGGTQDRGTPLAKTGIPASTRYLFCRGGAGGGGVSQFPPGTKRAVCLLRSRRRTFFFFKNFGRHDSFFWGGGDTDTPDLDFCPKFSHLLQVASVHVFPHVIVSLGSSCSFFQNFIWGGGGCRRH